MTTATAMNFKNGRICFLSRFGKLTVFPLGSPNNKAVGDQIVKEAKPIVMFEGGLYGTEDAAIARGMIEAKNFNDEDGYYLDLDCIDSDAIIEFWPSMSLKTKRAVAIAFIDGKTEDDAFELIPENEQVAPEFIDDSGTPFVITCPAKNCGFEAKGKQANGIIWAHMQAKHPNFTAD